ncbi:Kinesin-associated protein 3 like protein [Aduncisulcus paluster]|uniref:Kinesin-associated protein 3 like protein n=1 Tax=Aduncisulcus paluster TaxID=2918883 RepID=A0ABQ5JZH9_9EUKA|nr:Kinesin-associated protein 3 like protein [Aduncisulcus paluster]
MSASRTKLKQTFRTKGISVDIEERVIIVTFIVYEDSQKGRPVDSKASKKGLHKISVDPNISSRDIPTVAAEMIENCSLLNSSNQAQIERLLIQIVSESEGLDSDETFSPGRIASARRIQKIGRTLSAKLKGARQGLSSAKSVLMGLSSRFRTKAEAFSSLPPSLDMLDTYQEALYESINEKQAAAQCILRLVEEPDNIPIVASHGVLLGALARTLREEGTKCLPLMVDLVSIFMYIARSKEYRDKIVSHKLGSVMMKIPIIEFKRMKQKQRIIRELKMTLSKANARKIQKKIASTVSTGGSSPSSPPPPSSNLTSAPSSPASHALHQNTLSKLNKERKEYALMTKKQDQLLIACFEFLFSLSHDISVEERMAKKGIVTVLCDTLKRAIYAANVVSTRLAQGITNESGLSDAVLLQGGASDPGVLQQLVFVCAKFLHKLSCFSENAQEIEKNKVPQLLQKLIPVPQQYQSPQLLSPTLGVITNTCFSHVTRSALVHTHSFIDRLFSYASQAHQYREKVRKCEQLCSMHGIPIKDIDNEDEGERYTKQVYRALCEKVGDGAYDNVVSLDIVSTLIDKHALHTISRLENATARILYQLSCEREGRAGLRSLDGLVGYLLSFYGLDGKKTVGSDQSHTSTQSSRLASIGSDGNPSAASLTSVSLESIPLPVPPLFLNLLHVSDISYAILDREALVPLSNSLATQRSVVQAKIVRKLCEQCQLMCSRVHQWRVKTLVEGGHHSHPSQNSALSLKVTESFSQTAQVLAQAYLKPPELSVQDLSKIPVSNSTLRRLNSFCKTLHVLVGICVSTESTELAVEVLGAIADLTPVLLIPHLPEGVVDGVKEKEREKGDKKSDKMIRHSSSSSKVGKSISKLLSKMEVMINGSGIVEALKRSDFVLYLCELIVAKEADADLLLNAIMCVSSLLTLPNTGSLFASSRIPMALVSIVCVGASAASVLNSFSGVHEPLIMEHALFALYRMMSSATLRVSVLTIDASIPVLCAISLQLPYTDTPTRVRKLEDEELLPYLYSQNCVDLANAIIDIILVEEPDFSSKVIRERFTIYNHEFLAKISAEEEEMLGEEEDQWDTDYTYDDRYY